MFKITFQLQLFAIHWDRKGIESRLVLSESGEFVSDNIDSITFFLLEEER